MGSELQDLITQKNSQESPITSVIDKTDSLADLQQSTEKDFSFISQTESKVNYINQFNCTINLSK